MLKKLLPSLIIMLVLLLAGAIMHWMGRPVYWPGFIAMMFFYAAIFYIGTYAANMKAQDTEDSVMLAGRSLPLGVALYSP